MDPLRILPEEMWRNVLDNLTEVDDRLSASNTCQLWSFILKDNKIEWMFPGVFPLVFKYLSKSDVFSCRGTSKKWKKAVDSYLETGQPLITAPGSSGWLNHRVPKRVLEVDINVAAKRRETSLLQVLESFQTAFSVDNMSSLKNPFVSRSLMLHIPELHWTALEFFEKFGAHLWSLQMSITSRATSSEVDLYKFVWSILNNVPNLKKLSLVIVREFVFYGNFAQIQQQVELETQQIEQFLEDNPVPTLPQLNNLDVRSNVSFLQQLLEKVHAPQLTKYMYRTTQKFLPNNLSNLTEMAWYFKNQRDNYHASKLSKLQIPSLRRVSIYLDNLDCTWRKIEDNCLEHLFEAVESYKLSLTHLSIIYRFCNPVLPAHLDLPFVEEICLQYMHSSNEENVNYSFLSGLKSLRKLICVVGEHSYLRCIGYETNARRIRLLKEQTIDLQYYLSLVQIYGGNVSEEVHNSNIWQLVPSLDVIEVQVITYTDSSTTPRPFIYTRMNMERTLSKLDRSQLAEKTRAPPLDDALDMNKCNKRMKLDF